MPATIPSVSPTLEYWHPGIACCDPTWEEAYQRFETAAEERQKFLNRFRQLGVLDWPRDSAIVELFCGRGNGLRLLEDLGFTNLRGVDLSPHLLRTFRGRSQLYVGDCRELQFEPCSMDAVIVQGGLHHLPDLTANFPRVLDEIVRILRPGGRVVIVEPWLTPFLRFVHAVARQPVFRRLSRKLDAFQTMTDREAETYFQWLSQPDMIEKALLERVDPEMNACRFGKLLFVGRKPLSRDMTSTMALGAPL